MFITPIFILNNYDKLAWRDGIKKKKIILRFIELIIKIYAYQFYYKLRQNI